MQGKFSWQKKKSCYNTCMSLSPDVIERIRAWAAQGVDLNGIQKNLSEEGISVRFMELRFILLDNNIEIAQPEAATPEQEEEKAQPAPAVTDVEITLDELQIPGTMLSGKAIFPSGIRGAWCFDAQGSFAWTDLSDRPSAEELQVFQNKLNAMLRQG